MTQPLPRIIQAGAEPGVSSTWRLARAVAQAGQLGVISAALLPVRLARQLQRGDFDGHLRRALEAFPYPGPARRIWERFFVPGGKSSAQPFDLVSQPTLHPPPPFVELSVLASFIEVHLAKEGHSGTVGMQFHEDAASPLLPTVYGALMAKVDVILTTSSGVPALISALDRLAGPARATSVGSPTHRTRDDSCGFDPQSLGFGNPAPIRWPRILVRLAEAGTTEPGQDGWVESVHGLIAEAAGDRVDDLAPALRTSGLPVWMGGANALKRGLNRVLVCGGSGLALSLPFLFCKESGLNPTLKARVLDACLHGSPLPVQTLASSDRSPVRLIQDLGATEGDVPVRERICDVGWFRKAYQRPDGTVGYRCPGEPVELFGEKGGDATESALHPCLCNGLLASLGLGQTGSTENAGPVLVPVGEDLDQLTRFIRHGRAEYTAAEAIGILLES